MKSAPAKKSSYRTKRCADCSTELSLTAVRCTGCGRRVGPADQHGRAKKPIDWTAYGMCAFAWIAFGLFAWWAFFKE
jgi:hypothetical protein